MKNQPILALFILISFCVIIVGAGHGIAPMGYLMVFGSFSEWGSLIFWPWIGVFALLSSVFLRGSGARYLAIASHVILALSLFSLSLVPKVTLVWLSSILFWPLLSVRTFYLLREIQRDMAAKQPPPPHRG